MQNLTSRGSYSPIRIDGGNDGVKGQVGCRVLHQRLPRSSGGANFPGMLDKWRIMRSDSSFMLAMWMLLSASVTVTNTNQDAL